LGHPISCEVGGVGVCGDLGDVEEVVMATKHSRIESILVFKEEWIKYILVFMVDWA